MDKNDFSNQKCPVNEDDLGADTIGDGNITEETALIERWTEENITPNRTVDENFHSQPHSAHFQNSEQLKSAFAAYEAQQLQKLKEDNVLGVVNFEFVNGSMSNTLGEGNLVSPDICNENIAVEETPTSTLDGIDLRMNLNNPLKLANSVVDDGVKVNKHQSLSEQIAGVLSKTVDVLDNGDFVRNPSDKMLDIKIDSGSANKPTYLTPEHTADSSVDNEISSLREQLQSILLEKRDMQTHMQQQASSILHFKAYCQSLTTKLEVADAKAEEERSEAAITLEKEVGVLNDQLKSHVDSLRILVEEKTSLEKSSHLSKKLLVEKEDQIRTIQEELRFAQNAKADAELLANNSDSVDKTVIEALRRELNEQRQTIADLSQEVAEHSSKFLAKEQEVTALLLQQAQLKSKHEMAELNLQQLRVASSNNNTNVEACDKKDNGSAHPNGIQSSQESNAHDNIVRLKRENETQLKRIKELTLYIQQATEDREQIIHQYTSYSQQLTSQIETLTNSLNDTKMANHNIACR